MKRLFIILFLASMCYGTPIYLLDTTYADLYTSHQLPIADSTLDIGSATYLWRFIYGDVFTDGTAYWESNQLYGFTEIDADSIVAHVDLYGETITGIDIFGTTILATIITAEDLIGTNITGTTILGTTLTDGTFTTTGGVVSATTYNDLILRQLEFGNICLGLNAGNSGQAGDYNIFIGDEVGSDTTTGEKNVFVGYIAGDSVTAGDLNVGIGYYSLGQLTTGNYNTSIGALSGNNANGSNNVFIGYYTGVFETGSNTFLLDDRLRANQATGRARALQYGIFADTPAGQSLRVNADFTVLGDDVWFQTITDSTQSFSIFDSDAGLPVFEVDTTNERIAIGAHPGGVGASKLLLYGTQANATGPHMQFMTDEDAYPTMQLLNYSHDSMSVVFDAYWDGAWKSSDLGSNARIQKNLDNLRFRYDSGIAQGGAVTWNDAINIDLTNGNVGIGGTLSPDSTLQVVGDTRLGADTTHYTEFSNRGEMEMHGNARVSKHITIGAATWKRGATAPTESYENIFPTLVFADGRDDEAHYTSWVPFKWDNTTDMEVHVHWQMDDDTQVGNVLWNLNYIGVKEGEDPAGAGTLISQLSAGNHPDDELIDTIFTTKMLAANLEREDDLGLRLWRNGDDGTDDLTENAELIAVHIHFTMNQLGEPGLIPVTDVLLLDDGASKLLLDDGASFMLIRI